MVGVVANFLMFRPHEGSVDQCLRFMFQHAFFYFSYAKNRYNFSTSEGDIGVNGQKFGVNENVCSTYTNNILH